MKHTYECWKCAAARDDHLGLGITLRNIGSCYENLGDKQKALDYYQQSLEFARKAGNHFYTATTLIISV